MTKRSFTIDLTALYEDCDEEQQTAGTVTEKQHHTTAPKAGPATARAGGPAAAAKKASSGAAPPAPKRVRSQIEIDAAKTQWDHDTTHLTAKNVTEAEKILETWGVAIVPDLLDGERCDKMVSGMWDWLELKAPGLDRNNTETYKAVMSLLPLHGMLHQHWGAGVAPFAVDVRQDTDVMGFFAGLWRCQEEFLLSSLDGFSAVNMPEHKAGTTYRGENGWLHLDQSPARNAHECWQGFVTGTDTERGDATLVVLAGSHLLHREFAEAWRGQWKDQDWNKLTDDQIKWYLDRGCTRIAVTAPRGSLVLWDSRTVHAGQSPMAGRANPKPRCVVYTCFMPRALAKREDIVRKAQGFLNGETASHWAARHVKFPPKPNPFMMHQPLPDPLPPAAPRPQLTPLGIRIFGLDTLDRKIVPDRY